MSDVLSGLQHRIASAGELKTVVRTMKAIAASNISRYEQAVRALDVYDDTVRRGLAVSLRREAPFAAPRGSDRGAATVVLGSDHGLVGQFNDELAGFVRDTLADFQQPLLWCVGERLNDRLIAAKQEPAALFAVPTSLHAITVLVAQLLVHMERWIAMYPHAPLLIVHNRPLAGALYAPVSQRLLPLDETWRQSLLAPAWPVQRLPEVQGDEGMTLRALIREYLFVSLYRACAESLASENASRLAAMERAGKNIDEVLAQFRHAYNRLRQERIDEELFDVIAGFEAQATAEGVNKTRKEPLHEL